MQGEDSKRPGLLRASYEPRWKLAQTERLRVRGILGKGDADLGHYENESLSGLTATANADTPPPDAT
jgi:hypothetical protein